MLRTCRLTHLSVCVCVGLSVRKVYCGKTAEWIRMPFGMVSGVGTLMYGMGVHEAQREEVDFGFLGLFAHWPHGFNGLIFKRNVFDLCVKN